jgi:hypothetical protein
MPPRRGDTYQQSLEELMDYEYLSRGIKASLQKGEIAQQDIDHMFEVAAEDFLRYGSPCRVLETGPWLVHSQRVEGVITSLMFLREEYLAMRPDTVRTIGYQSSPEPCGGLERISFSFGSTKRRDK